MPLPINSTLSILGASRIGDALPSKPKKAMVVRLSPETLDALEATSPAQIQLQFGENTAIFVGQTCFPMAHLPENAIHELYLRTSSASKKNAPLKLYANLSGKLTAEMKEIGDELRDKIRESTQGAAAQKSSRATVFMPTPDPQPSSKKRKEHSSSNMFHKPLKSVPKVVKAPIPSSTPPPTQKNLTSPATMAPQSSGVPFRRRFIQCLARGEKQEDDLFKLLRITDRNSNLRSEMLNLLDELADSRTEKSHKVYTLKPMAWKEVRPFEYSGLSQQERVQMARAGRAALKSLRIPDNDTLWDHFQYKSPAPMAVVSDTQGPPPDNQRTFSSSSTVEPRTSQQEEAKRGSSSRDPKEKKAKVKAEALTDSSIEDENQKAIPRSRPDNVTEVRRPETTQSTRKREIPPSKTRTTEREALPRAAPNNVTHSSRFTERDSTSRVASVKDGYMPTKVRRNAEVPMSESERGTPAPSTERIGGKVQVNKREFVENDLAEGPKKKDRNSERAKRKGEEFDDRSEKRLQRKLDRDPGPEDSSRRRAQDELGASRSTTTTRVGEDDYAIPHKRRPIEDYSDSKLSSKHQKRLEEDNPDAKSSKQRSWDGSNRPSKRKSSNVDDSSSEHPPQKKFRPNRDPMVPSFSASREDGDYISIKNKLEANSRLKSNPQAKTHSQESIRPSKADPSFASSSLKSTRTMLPSKIRRRSPVYTSSEDEKDDDLPLSKRLPRKNSITAPLANGGIRFSTRPLPSDHGALRALYDSTYLDYLTNMQKLLVQKAKIDALLRSGDLDGSGSVTDSDGDVELLLPEELETLSATHRRLHSELKAIHDTHGQPVEAS